MWNDVDNTHEFDHVPNVCDTMAAIHVFFCSLPQGVLWMVAKCWAPVGRWLIPIKKSHEISMGDLQDPKMEVR